MVFYWENLSSLQALIGEDRRPFLIYDESLLAVIPGFRSWICGYDPLTYPVRAGEELKNVEAFPFHIQEILKKVQRVSRKQLVIVSMGGGSVGDFTGFVASVLKRGVPLMHIPSTWLSAMDSAHGGKTALNVGTYKNQIGCFYPAEKIIICRDLLQTLPKRQILSALGELCKMALIGGGEFYARFKKIEHWGFEQMWQSLAPAIEHKYAIVEQDPKEEKGIREQLNLGHSLGHILEVGHGLPHGEAVAQGLWFSLNWSYHLYRKKGILMRDQMEELRSVLEVSVGPRKPYQVTEPFIRESLFHDKKSLPGSRLNFVFIKGPGNMDVCPITMDSFIAEAKRQGWVNGV